MRRSGHAHTARIRSQEVPTNPPHESTREIQHETGTHHAQRLIQLKWYNRQKEDNLPLTSQRLKLRLQGEGIETERLSGAPDIH